MAGKATHNHALTSTAKPALAAHNPVRSGGRKNIVYMRTIDLCNRSLAVLIFIKT